MPLNHQIRREGDEYVCSCGLRWDIREDDPHGEQPEPVEPRQIIDQLKMELANDGE